MNISLQIKDSFTQSLPGDSDTSNHPRQVYNACYSHVEPRKPSKPSLIHATVDLAKEMGITEDQLYSEDFLNIFSGRKIMPNTRPYAMCYGGHQFGSWAGQLGDGRAINLGEIKHQDQQWQLQLKGAGPTPYSRRADGLAVLRSSIREHLCSEAMHHLGIPTTRSLSLALTGDQVLRDIMYDGHPEYEKGAIVCRAAQSFIRFGNFQIFAARRDFNNLKILTDYTIKEHFPHITNSDPKTRYLQFFQDVVNTTIDMVIHWNRVGFVHGVMNTDNMSIHGLTIDYGPYGWLDGYDHLWTPNTTDRQQRRYRYGHQGYIALWNLYQLANALFLLIEDSNSLEAILEQGQKDYEQKYTSMMSHKLGLYLAMPTDENLIAELEHLLQLHETDMTIFFRNLAQFDEKINSENLQEIPAYITEAFYEPELLKQDHHEAWINWLQKYSIRLRGENQSFETRSAKMNNVNPKYVLRNYMAQLAIEDAEKQDYQLIKSFAEILKKPYDEQIQAHQWFAKRPDWARNKIGCSMLSCSS